MSVPRWHKVFSETLSDHENATYTLSTVGSGPSGPFPRARSVIHRGIVSPSPTRPLLLTTTDIRTPKAQHLHTNPNSEATFWFPDLKVQFRIVSSTYILPHPEHAWHAAFPGKYLADNDNDRIDWDNKRLDIFDGISGYLRATFARPTPGTPMDSYDEAKKWPETTPKRAEATGVEQKVIDEALINFALVVLDPSEVEYIELGPIPNRRTKWIKKGDGWDEQILVP